MSERPVPVTCTCGHVVIASAAIVPVVAAHACLACQLASLTPDVSIILSAMRYAVIEYHQQRQRALREGVTP